MGSLEIIFGTVVAVLAGGAVLGALIYAITWEVCQIRTLLRRHRTPTADDLFWADRRAVRIPERRQ